jgi:hypothetical protein
MALCTIFSGFNQPVEDKVLLSIVNDIKEGKYKADIERIRSLIASGNIENADQLKRQLPAFTPSATFKGGRKPEFLENYSGILHLDFDKLSPDQLTSAFQSICNSPFTRACFLSPGGKGYKVFVEVSSTANDHNHAYKMVQEHYESLVGIACDPKCKDITRLCFVSDDPNCFVNTESHIFECNPIQEESTAEISDPQHSVDFQTVFEDCIRFTEQKSQYSQGNRNNFIYLLASNCNRNGLPEHIATELILTNFDLPEPEMRNSIKSAYLNHTSEFSSSFVHQKKTDSNQSFHEVDYLKNTPTIEAEIIDKLPDLLKSGASVFPDPRERDVFLTGALAILSGCLPCVSGVYAQEIVYPNLFAFIIAPAASGKGVMKFAKVLANKHHEQLVSRSREEQQRFECEMNQFKTCQRSRKKDEPVEEPPQQPRFKVLFIPANSSYAKILFHLEQNDGEGIICETEADTMSNVLKQEWGGYSDMLRKSFHHERLSSSKKTNNEYIEVDNPRLSVALSGTPSQVTGLINSAEDGLFSRFLFYAFKVEQVWKDVSPAGNTTNLTEHFADLSSKVYDMILFLAANPTIVTLSDDQWDILNNTCGFWLKETIAFHSDEAGGVVKRLGLILYRIAMIFTALRKYEIDETSHRITCTNSDFFLAIKLANKYLQHSILMFNNLPRQTVMATFLSGENKEQFFKSLPAEFKRAEAIELGSKYNLSPRSVDALLRSLDGKYLSQPKFGFYRKI